MPFGFDLTPGINVGNAFRQIFDPGHDYDVLDSLSVQGGDRNPVGPTFLGVGAQAKPSQNATVYPDNSPYSGGVDGGAAAGNGGGGGGTNYAALNDTLYQIDQGLKQYNDALARTNSQQQTALGNVQSDYNAGYNRLLGQQAKANRDFETNKDNQTQDYLNARDDIANNTRNLILNARRLLGSQGAGGGSADRYAVPVAGQLEGANQNAKVQQTNARNLAALTTGHEDDERNFQNSFSDLSKQLESSKRGVQSQFEQQRAEILQNIANLTGQRKLAQGGSYQSALAAAQPTMSRVNSILDNIDRLAANPTQIREQAVQLARPDLAQYVYDRFTAPVANRQAPQDTSLPIAALLGQNDDQRRQQLGL